MGEFVTKIEQHKNEFYHFVYRNVWDSGVADDVFSSAVLTAYENAHKYVPGTNFRAWMFRILANKCFVANRETRHATEPLDTAAAEFIALEDNPGYGDFLANPEKLFDQLGDEVHLAIRTLSTAQRSCILLRAVERMSYKEIAEILEMPVGTVVTHLARGRKKLREQLLDYAKKQGHVRTPPNLRELPRDPHQGTARSGNSS